MKIAITLCMFLFACGGTVEAPPAPPVDASLDPDSSEADAAPTLDASDAGDGNDRPSFCSSGGILRDCFGRALDAGCDL